MKGATEAPKSKPTGNAKGTADKESPNKDTNSKPTNPDSKSSKDNTTKAPKATKITTTTKPTTTKAKPAPEPNVPVPQYEWKAPWEITMYSKAGCEGDYYHLEGYNKEFLDDEGCLALHGGINSKFTETGVTCKWWTEDGFTWSGCDTSKLKKPESWVLKNGYCAIFTIADCDCFDSLEMYYKSEGCHNRTDIDPPNFAALQCSINGHQ